MKEIKPRIKQQTKLDAKVLKIVVSCREIQMEVLGKKWIMKNVKFECVEVEMLTLRNLKTVEDGELFFSAS